MAEEKRWKPLDLVKVTAEYLAGKSVPSPRLDAELLLCKATGIARRVELYAGFEREVGPDDLAKYREMIRRRAGREPVSRILGEREFMGIRFAVTPDVLSPRPETEFLVEAALARVDPVRSVLSPEAEDASRGPGAMTEELEKLLDAYAEDADSDGETDAEKPLAAPVRPADFPLASRMDRRSADRSAAGPARTPRALDLGTGSGCIAVSLAARLPGARVTAVDISPNALKIARENARAVGVLGRIDFRLGDWLAVLPENEGYDLILSNPPYLVPGDPEIWPEVSRFDPPLALYGGNDGLEAYRAIVPGLPGRLVPGGVAFLEVGAGQAEAVARMMRKSGLVGVAAHKDYGGVERIVSGERGR